MDGRARADVPSVFPSPRRETQDLARMRQSGSERHEPLAVGRDTCAGGGSSAATPDGVDRPSPLVESALHLQQTGTWPLRYALRLGPVSAEEKATLVRPE